MPTPKGNLQALLAGLGTTTATAVSDRSNAIKQQINVAVKVAINTQKQQPRPDPIMPTQYHQHAPPGLQAPGAAQRCTKVWEL